VSVLGLVDAISVDEQKSVVALSTYNRLRLSPSKKGHLMTAPTVDGSYVLYNRFLADAANVELLAFQSNWNMVNPLRQPVCARPPAMSESPLTYATFVPSGENVGTIIEGSPLGLKTTAVVLIVIAPETGDEM
jgi:hypothetical protein